MSSKVDDDKTVEVPEASPDSNDEKQPTDADQAPQQSRRNLYLGLSAVLLAIVTISITVPLVVSKSTNAAVDGAISVAETTIVDEIAQQFAGNESDDKPQCYPPIEGDTCITEDSYQECLDLVVAGCKMIYSTYSCPPQHRCASRPAAVASMPPSTSPPSMCAPPLPDDDCVSEESYQACLQLEDEGCNMIIATASCPPIYGCADPTAETAGNKTDSGGGNVQEEIPAACTMELAYCSDGTDVGRTGPNCEFEQCPEGTCLDDVQVCKDKSEFRRDPSNDCQFPQCPLAVACTMEVKECQDGTYVGRVGPDCNFLSCPEDLPVGCTLELAHCSDGTPVGRSGPNCEFEKCPEGTCLDDVDVCNGGSEFKRDPSNGCQFPKCG